MSRLVLTRKIDQEVIIHDDKGIVANIKIIKIDGNQVRIAFDASHQINIDRKEIYNKKQFEDS